MQYTARVLVVDDEDRFRENMIRLLKAEGHSASGAANGVQALEMLDHGDYDVVLLDLRMPELSGEEVMQAIQRRATPVEVVVLTGHASVDVAMEMLGMGAFDYLLKPASAGEILEKIKQACEKRMLDEGRLEMKDILSGTK